MHAPGHNPSRGSAHRGAAPRRILTVALLALALLGAACGNDDDGGSSSSTTAPAGGGGGGGGGGEGGEGGEAESGPGTPAPQPLPEQESMVLAYSAPIEAWANVLLADQLGEFEAENLDVEIQTIPGPDGLVLLSQGRVDVQTAGISAGFMNSVAAGQPIRMVANTFVEDAPEAGFWINNDYLTDGEPDPEKLEGTQVMPGIGGGGFGNPGALPLWNWMQEIGLEAEDVETIDVTSPVDAANVVINGGASISMGLTPHWSTIEESGCCTFLVPTTISGTFLANQTFLEDRPEVAQAFFRALMRANRTYLQGDYHDDPEVLAALAEQTQVPEETLAEQPALGFSPDLELLADDVFPDFQEQFRTFELLSYDDDLATEDVVDTSPVDAVLEG